MFEDFYEALIKGCDTVHGDLESLDKIIAAIEDDDLKKKLRRHLGNAVLHLQSGIRDPINRAFSSNEEC